VRTLVNHPPPELQHPRSWADGEELEVNAAGEPAEVALNPCFLLNALEEGETDEVALEFTPLSPTPRSGQWAAKSTRVGVRGGVGARAGLTPAARPARFSPPCQPEGVERPNARGSQ